MKQICICAFFAALFYASAAHAGGPRYVAGTSYFPASMTGKPIVWANGQVKYYTDLGSLSATVTQSQANTMVANAAAVWNAVPTAAVKIFSGGSLSEDVNGSNVTASGNTITLPADIQSSYTAKPIAIVYDQDGSVINTFFGPGASSAATCQQDAVFTFIDNLASSGNIVHALMLVNGLCAANAANTTVLQYQLVRAFGQVLGLDWSQTNEEMFAPGGGGATSAGLAGWPIMHPIERLCNASGVTCMPNATTLRPDDIAALNRLYPVTSANIASFSGKKLTATNTLSVTGAITFRNGQGMQGVNVVLRPMLPGSDLPDIRYTVTAVSGVTFHGNAGNVITGLTDSSGNALARFGSGDTTTEGYFDLSGVPIPAGETTDTWQLSFEPINPLYTSLDSVGPYTTGQVAPSGTMPAIALPGLTAGSSVIQNVSIGDSAGDSFSGDDGEPAAPITVPPSGEWTARLAGYGHSSWLQWWAKANRVFTVEANALDESGNTAATKAQLVLGMWNGTDTDSVSPVTWTTQPFNGDVAGLTTLPVMTLADSEVRLGVADMRGDGRPDYLYRGRVLYADTVQPAILPAAGGPIAITGMGFHPNSVVTVNGVNATVTSVTPTEITAISPPLGVTGDVPVQIEDPKTLGISIIAEGLSYAAQNADTITLVSAPSGSVNPGAPLSFTVAVNNGASAAPGATVTYAVTEGSATLACGQPSCSVVTAANGSATLTIAANSAATTVVTATLSNGTGVATQFTAGASGSTPAISALTPTLYLAAGSTAQWTPQGLVLKNGAPSANAAVTWTPVTAGVSAPTTASLSGANGIVTQQLAAGPVSAGVTVPVNACLYSTGTCAQFNVISIPPASAQLSPIAGVSQLLPYTQSFTPVTLEVTDPAGDPLAGATVTFYETLDSWTPPCPPGSMCPPAPLLDQQTVQATSASDGTVILNPIAGSGQPVRLYVTAVAGASALLNFELERHP